MICEKYLKCIPDTIYRVALSRLRLSSHDLNIEEGRKLGISHEQRLCPFQCKSVEDEFHFILVCPVYQQIRERFISKFYYNPACEWKFILLLQTDKPYTLQSLGKYIFYSFKKRQQLLTDDVQ